MTGYEPPNGDSGSAIRPVETILAQLGELRSILSTARAYGDRDFASRMGLRWIERQERSLLRELRAAELLASDVPSTLSGVLTSGDIERRRFELRVGDDVYAGRVSDFAMTQLKSIPLGLEVDATLSVEARTPDDSPPASVTFTLENVRPRSPAGAAGA